jgi:hypothetical protein
VALSYAARKQLLAANVPEATEVRLELQDYLARTGMAPPDFARRINYSRETVYQFLNGQLQPDFLQRRPHPGSDSRLHRGPSDCDAHRQFRETLRDGERTLTATVFLRQ